MSRHRSSSRKAPPDIGLHMECVEEDLEPSQIAYYNKAEKEYNEVQSKLDNYVKKMKAEVVEKGENCLVLQVNATTSVSLPTPVQISTPTGKNTRQSAQSNQNYQQMVGQGIMTRSSANSTGNTYLVMDPRLGFVVGQIPSNAQSEPLPASSKIPTTRGRQITTTGTVMVTTRAKSGLKKQASITPEPEVLTPPVTRTRDKTQKHQSSSPQTSPQIVQPQVYSSSTGTSSSSGNYKIKVNAKPLPTPTKPAESTALGGLSAGSKTPWKPITEESSNKPDSREVVFNKASGKTFPSLVVVARPHLKVKYIPQATITQERTALDAKVKGVLMYTSTKFIEWLIQQGLIRSEQYCPTHTNDDLTPVKLKLGMYSDVSKFPYSGGYVWISDCCPSQFVSVFSGSIFEGAPHPPTTLLKLIYHWACQTNVQNVVQWVKVDNLYLKNFYTNMRAVCTQAVYEKYVKMGGPRKKIEVGVISLGTTSQDGNRRQVKVEVLGVMDQESKLVRLRAVEPLSDERSFKKRFVKILEPLEEWVDKESVILTDFTVAKTALNFMGFHTVFQTTNESKFLNQNIMEYLRRIVPRMFQNTLSLLSRQIIQQFLDELVWREMWGPIPSQAFVNIVAHIAEQTKMDVSPKLLIRLNRVASNPFKKWDYSVWKGRPSPKPLQRSATSQESLAEVNARISKTPDTPETPTVGKGIRTRKRAAEQSLAETCFSVAAKKVPKITIKDKLKKEEKAVKKEEKVIKKDTNDKMPEEIVKFLNEGKQIPLSGYYYGSLAGDQERSYYYRGPFNVKCCVCNKRFTQNIVLMKHMILHCQTEPMLVIDLKKVHQCECCFLGFNTSTSLKAHLEEIHSVVNNKINSNLICHICEEKFKNRNDLICHMHRTHVELELPYECGVCHFRTSIYKVFVDHFLLTHKGEEHVFCPYCLKVVTLAFKGEVISLNVLFYMTHLEKHQRLSLIKDCNRCQLSFIHKGILDQHLDADHGSWKNETGVEPVSDLSDGILMPEPGEVIKAVSPVRPQRTPKTKNMFASNKFKCLEVNGIDDNMACVECEGSLTKYEHFTGSFNCLKCRFASCCERAMVEHLAIFHDSPHLQFTKGTPTVLSREMFCICGYSSRSGNRIAKHLAVCERKSAYASKEAASAAIKSPSKHCAEENKKQGEGQNMLNMLGLVRKSPDATGAIESTKMEVDQGEEVVNNFKSEKTDFEKSITPLEEEPQSSDHKTDQPEVDKMSKCLVDLVTQEIEDKIEDEKSEEIFPKSQTEEPSTSSESSSDPQVTVVENKKQLIEPSETPMEVTEERNDDEKTGKNFEVTKNIENEGLIEVHLVGTKKEERSKNVVEKESNNEDTVELKNMKGNTMEEDQKERRMVEEQSIENLVKAEKNKNKLLEEKLSEENIVEMEVRQENIEEMEVRQENIVEMEVRQENIVEMEVRQENSVEDKSCKENTMGKKQNAENVMETKNLEQVVPSKTSGVEENSIMKTKSSKENLWKKEFMEKKTEVEINEKRIMKEDNSEDAQSSDKLEFDAHSSGEVMGAVNFCKEVENLKPIRDLEKKNEVEVEPNQRKLNEVESNEKILTTKKSNLETMIEGDLAEERQVKFGKNVTETEPSAEKIVVTEINEEDREGGEVNTENKQEMSISTEDKKKEKIKEINQQEAEPNAVLLITDGLNDEEKKTLELGEKAISMKKESQNVSEETFKNLKDEMFTKKSFLLGSSQNINIENKETEKAVNILQDKKETEGKVKDPDSTHVMENNSTDVSNDSSLKQEDCGEFAKEKTVEKL